MDAQGGLRFIVAEGEMSGTCGAGICLAVAICVVAEAEDALPLNPFGI